MPKVAIDARDAAGPRLRGWGRYTHELVAAMERSDAGDGLELRVLRDGGPGPELLFEQVSLPRILRREGAAAVHAPNCFLPLRRPCPGVVTIHDLAFETHPEDFSRRTGWKYRAFAPRAARSAERVICVSDFTRGQVCERYGVDPDRTRVIHEAPALPLGSEAPPPGPYLLAVGDLRLKKNLRRLVEAFGRLRAEGAPHRLVLAGVDLGEGRHLGAEGVELTGFVSDGRLDALMRGADALVHPSLHEGFGLVVLEAMARGVPVAAARAGALPETGGDSAVYFDPHDPGDIATTLGELLADEALRRKLADAGRERAARFTWERAAERTLAVYRELTG
jgi:glycosyltransferase involved in cell wall biosynthesis